MDVFVDGIGLFAPGLWGWSKSQPVLTNQAPYRLETIPPIRTSILPRNEARRTTFTIRLALHAAQEATFHANSLLQDMCAVFTCSGGDPETLDKLLTALALTEKPISPNLFNNSVHNAPAGYWSIATGSQQTSTSLTAYDASFGAGLLEAVSLLAVERRPVLLVSYDVPPTPLLLPFRPVKIPFATALLLSASKSSLSQSRFIVNVVYEQKEDSLRDTYLETLRMGNPAARSLPLLQAMAEQRQGPVVLPYFPASQLVVRLESC
jgi:hypothetical protein